MTVETDVNRAIERVRAEKEWTGEKREAFERFGEEVSTIEPGGTVSGPATLGATTAVRGAAGKSGSRVTTVLEAFDDHLAPYSGDSTEAHDSVHEAVAAEFSADLAVALCGGDSAGVLTPELKGVVQSETDRRLDELRVMDRALNREIDSLCAVDACLGNVCEWLVDHNPTPLSELGFPELRGWHERLGDLRGSLSGTAADRQDHLHSATGGPEQVGIEQLVLVEYLYAGFESTFPALTTVAKLDDACRDAQQSIRDHLTRRV